MYGSAVDETLSQAWAGMPRTGSAGRASPATTRPDGLPFPATQVVSPAAQGAIAAIALDHVLLLEDVGLPASALA
jgi:hypothetical protein